MSDCPVNVGVENVSQWAACLRRAAGPAISSIDPTHPSYMNAHTAGPNPWVWLCVGIGALIFTWVMLGSILSHSSAKPKVKVNPMRPRTGSAASVVTEDGTVWARTRPAWMGGQSDGQ